MRIAHISDLHLGKTLHGFSLLDDQDFILKQIVQILKEILFLSRLFKS